MLTHWQCLGEAIGQRAVRNLSTLFTACDLIVTELKGGLIKLVVETSNGTVFRPGLLMVDAGN